MALIERPPERALVPAAATPSTTYGVFRRPVETTGWKSWVFTVDHKKIGIMYAATALFFFLVEGRNCVEWVDEASPLRRGQTNELLREVKMVARSVVISTFVTAGVQAAGDHVRHRQRHAGSDRWQIRRR